MNKLALYNYLKSMRNTGFDFLSLGKYKGVEYHIQWNGYLYRSGRLLPVFGWLGIPKGGNKLKTFASEVWQKIHEPEDLNMVQVLAELEALKRNPQKELLFLRTKITVTYHNKHWVIKRKRFRKVK